MVALCTLALALSALAVAASPPSNDSAPGTVLLGGEAATVEAPRAAAGQGDDAPTVHYPLDSRSTVDEHHDEHQATLHARAKSFADIEITSSLPTAPRSLAALFSSSLSSLSSRASALVPSSSSTSREPFPRGIPGTALSDPSAAQALQAALDCFAGTGHWVHDPAGQGLVQEGRGLVVHKQDARYAACDRRFYKGREPGEGVSGWDVRPSLQWRWVPSRACPAFPVAREPSRTRFCTLLAHKSFLLLGDATQYSLHDLVLDHAATRPQSCYGDLYCKEHQLCGEVLAAAAKHRKGEAGPSSDVESARADERVFGHVPLPPGMAPPHGGTGPLHARDDALEPRADRGASASHRRYPSATYGTLLRYRRTDGLRPSSAHTGPTFRHPLTGVRELNQPWLPDARRSDVVVLTKAPLPLPLRTTTTTTGSSGAAGHFWAELDAATARGPHARAEALLRLADEWTARTWLPELVDALGALRAQGGSQLVVYRSGWRQHADCAEPGPALADGAAGDGPGPHEAPPGLGALLGAVREDDAGEDGEAEGADEVPLHIAWHNAQLVLQNAVARRSVLAHFGALFLDLETPLSVWRSGMVGSSAAPTSTASGSLLVVQARDQGKGLRSPVSGDCTRYCFPSPGRALETHFLGALGRVFEAGWAGDRGQFESEWVGDEFVNIREREAVGT